MIKKKRQLHQCTLLFPFYRGLICGLHCHRSSIQGNLHTIHPNNSRTTFHASAINTLHNGEYGVGMSSALLIIFPACTNQLNNDLLYSTTLLLFVSLLQNISLTSSHAHSFFSFSALLILQGPNFQRIYEFVSPCNGISPRRLHQNQNSFIPSIF